MWANMDENNEKIRKGKEQKIEEKILEENLEENIESRSVNWYQSPYDYLNRSPSRF